MDYLDKRFIVGIDLGTTNSAVSYIDLQEESEKKSRIKIFNLPQLTGAGEISKQAVLPSFLYIPGKYDISKEAVLYPWNTRFKGKKSGIKNKNNNFVGIFARDHGAKVPARLVSSAKSWLCHSGVDRRAKILPWGADDEVSKVSPVQATASYLDHIRKVWNENIEKNPDYDEQNFLENQIVIITVPASFDEAARDLTLESAAEAGLPNVTLLEEPLAAFYSWLMLHEKDWNKFVNPGELILVCDVGGGTTDFTLITLSKEEQGPRFERIAVGDHLILGGDNIDLALARRMELRFGKKKPALTGDRWKALCHQCRQAKEIILDNLAESKRITLMGDGTKVIAETLSAELERKDVEETVVDGFFPLVNQKISKRVIVKKGITEFGLPYEQEPAITRHLGCFLEKHKDDVKRVLKRENYAPELILFNGGSLKPVLIKERIRSAIRYWFKKEETSGLPRELENPTPDLAVALGASYYGLVKIGRGVKVGSGSARAYYIGIGGKKDGAQGKEKKNAICIVERGTDEGTNIELKDKKFGVLANEPVTFDIYSSSYRSGDRCGDIISIDNTLTSLPPIQTIVQFGKKGVRTKIPVCIEANYTEMGTLDLWCISMVSSHRWQLKFQLRTLSAAVKVLDEEIFEASMVEKTEEKLNRTFSNRKAVKCLETLVKDISKIVARPRDKWPLGFIRTLADDLLKLISVRNFSQMHETRWYNLMGFCLRPGFGDGFDEHRMKELWKIYKHGPVNKKNAQVHSEWWIMWRRIAGGLKPGQQRQFVQDLGYLLMPKKETGKKIKLSPQQRLEIWMAVANLERLYVKDKIKLGRQILSEIKPQRSKHQDFWSLSRIGARELLYGSADRVIPPDEVSGWIETLLSQNWQNPKPVGFAILQLARKTGDFTRDIDSLMIERIIDWLSQYEFFLPDLKFLKEVIPMNKQEENQIFGESLPAGIILH